nr:hypothetical protein [Pandoravirus aubagnensis]
MHCGRAFSSPTAYNLSSSSSSSLRGLSFSVSFFFGPIFAHFKPKKKELRSSHVSVLCVCVAFASFFFLCCTKKKKEKEENKAPCSFFRPKALFLSDGDHRQEGVETNPSTETSQRDPNGTTIALFLSLAIVAPFFPRTQRDSFDC